MKTNKNEELQSRREFFKSAAKVALPVLGTMLLLSSPIGTHAMTSCNGCIAQCMDGCTTTCKGFCEGSCKASCRGGNYGY